MTMKKLLLLIVLCTPVITNAQKMKYSRAYLGALLHDGKIGGSLILSYGIGKYIGIGAGVDLTSYKASDKLDSKFFAPFYGDLRVKYPARGIEPFVIGQFGKPSFTQTIVKSSPTSPRQLDVTGDYFYGVGFGVSSLRKAKPNVFMSATYRKYYFSYSPSNYSANYVDYSKEMLVLSAGLVF